MVDSVVITDLDGNVYGPYDSIEEGMGHLFHVPGMQVIPIQVNDEDKGYFKMIKKTLTE